MNFLYLNTVFSQMRVEDMGLNKFFSGGLLGSLSVFVSPEIFHDKWLQKEK